MKSNTTEYHELIRAPIDTIFSYFWDVNVDRSFHTVIQQHHQGVSIRRKYTNEDYFDWVATYCGMPL